MCRLPVHAAIQSKVQSICHLMADMQSKPAWSQCCVQAHASCLGKVAKTFLLLVLLFYSCSYQGFSTQPGGASQGFTRFFRLGVLDVW